MMKLPVVLILSALVVGLSSCDEKEAAPVDSVVQSLLTSLNEELTPISALDPNIWTDSDLKFMDEYASKGIVALGEATHGTSEFFKAKHRVFRYLVEKHGFKVFTIEADVGESMLINQAVMNSDKSLIVTLMLNNMHFWTWQTNEVRDLLFWMCDYNKGKPVDQKLQYWGVDCQYNTYYPEMLKSRLQKANVPFFSSAKTFLDETTVLTRDRFKTYSQTDFLKYLEKTEGLTDSITKYKDLIVASSSEKDIEFAGSSEKNFALTLHLVDVLRQTSEVIFNLEKGNSFNYRDVFMADNTGWVREQLGESKMFLWAHNFHVSSAPNWGTQGKYIKDKFPNDYASVGFLFSKGTFRAVTMTGPNQYGALEVQILDDEPLSGSISDVMSRTEGPVYTVRMSDLQKHPEWNTAFQKGIKYFQTGAVFNDKDVEAFYSNFDPNFFDRVIWFRITTSATKVL